jgi:hypothetical protein
MSRGLTRTTSLVIRIGCLTYVFQNVRPAYLPYRTKFAGSNFVSPN